MAPLGSSETRPQMDQLLARVDTDLGRHQLEAALGTQPFPHFIASERTGFYIKIDCDGTRTEGFFRSKTFIVV